MAALAAVIVVARNRHHVADNVSIGTLKLTGADRAEIGRVLAMASTPTFDPNKKVKSSDLNNPALERTYEPGSVQKVVTMAALADAGVNIHGRSGGSKSTVTR